MKIFFVCCVYTHSDMNIRLTMNWIHSNEKFNTDVDFPRNILRYNNNNNNKKENNRSIELLFSFSIFFWNMVDGNFDKQIYSIQNQRLQWQNNLFEAYEYEKQWGSNIRLFSYEYLFSRTLKMFIHNIFHWLKISLNN